eukprot:Awhi_evm1s12659
MKGFHLTTLVTTAHMAVITTALPAQNQRETFSVPFTCPERYTRPNSNPPFDNDSYECLPECNSNPDCVCPSYSPPGGLSHDKAPQFILLTFDDAITEISTSKMKRLFSLNNQGQCPIATTFYTSIADGQSNQVLTNDSIVQALFDAGHEIATHTYAHTAPPTPGQIDDARSWIVQNTDVSNNEIRGFRTPYLLNDENTFQRLYDLGFTYDSTRTTQPKDGQHLWPYTMDYGIPHSCTNCGNKKLEGFFEIPMNNMRDWDGQLISTMDPPNQNGYDGYDNYMANFMEHYCGSKAPLGIFLHAAWLYTEANEAALYQFMQDVLELDDVYFITNHQLTEYMKKPVEANEVPKSVLQDCNKNRMCFPPIGGCVFGTFSFQSCTCECFVSACVQPNDQCGYSGCKDGGDGNAPSGCANDYESCNVSDDCCAGLYCKDFGNYKQCKPDSNIEPATESTPEPSTTTETLTKVTTIATTTESLTTSE